MKRPVRGGHERDARTPVRRSLIWCPGARTRIKQQANRGERRTAHQHDPRAQD